MIFNGGLQNYKFLKNLSKGNQGQTFLVEGLDDQKFYFLKKFDKNNQKPKEIEFIDIRRQRNPRHRKLLKIYERFKDHSDIHYIMEYCEGGDIAQRLKWKNLEVLEVLQIAADVASQLEIIHELGFVHQDLKPSNIVFKKSRKRNYHRNVYKICDFGSLSKHSSFIKNNEKAQTQSRFLTAAYSAPEITFSSDHEQHQDFSVDVWSLGVTIFELMTNQKLFSGSCDFEIKQSIELYCENQKLVHDRIDEIQFKEEIKQFIKEMIHPDPTIRPKIKAVKEFFEKQLEMSQEANFTICKQSQIKIKPYSLSKFLFQIQNPQNIDINGCFSEDTFKTYIKNQDYLFLQARQCIAEQTKEIQFLQDQLVKQVNKNREVEHQISKLLENNQQSHVVINQRTPFSYKDSIEIIKQIGRLYQINVDYFTNQISNAAESGSIYYSQNENQCICNKLNEIMRDCDASSKIYSFQKAKVKKFEMIKDKMQEIIKQFELFQKFSCPKRQ